MLSISIIGLGRAGGALAIALNRAGFEIDQLVYRHRALELPELKGNRFVLWSKVESIQSDLLLIATQDQQIRTVAERISSFTKRPKAALHISGSLSSDVLESLKSGGVAIGSMHPLVSISDAFIGADRFANAYFCVEGDPEAVSAAESLVNSLDGRPFTIESRLKPLYHASAVMASGHVTALFDLAIETLSKCGIEPNSARSILFPLVESTIANLKGQSPAEALTGPFVRGDIDAFRRHLDALETGADENGRRIYLELAERSIRIAREGSAKIDALEELGRAISMAKRKTEC